MQESTPIHMLQIDLKFKKTNRNKGKKIIMIASMLRLPSDLNFRNLKDNYAICWCFKGDCRKELDMILLLNKGNANRPCICLNHTAGRTIEWNGLNL